MEEGLNGIERKLETKVELDSCYQSRVIRYEDRLVIYLISIDNKYFDGKGIKGNIHLSGYENKLKIIPKKVRVRTIPWRTVETIKRKISFPEKDWAIVIRGEKFGDYLVLDGEIRKEYHEAVFLGLLNTGRAVSNDFLKKFLAPLDERLLVEYDKMNEFYKKFRDGK